MTKEEAIKWLRDIANDPLTIDPEADAISMAIKALKQPECEDAVSRFEVLRLIDYSSHDLNDAVDNRYMQNEIKQLPSVTPKQPGWIPCTPETMPKDTGRYLCTYISDGLKWVQIFRYEMGKWFVPWYADEVTAWQELDEPYEGGHNDRLNQQTGGS